MANEVKDVNTSPASGAVDVGTAADVDEMMKKFDRESNIRHWTGTPKKIIRYLLSAFTVFMVYMNMFAVWDERIRRCLFMGFIFILVFLMYPAKKGDSRENHIPWYDWILMIVGAGSFFYYVVNFRTIVDHATRISELEVALGILGILILVECCRRVVGLPIICVASCFVIYAFATSTPITYKVLRRIIYNLFYTTTGVIGTPVGVCSTFIVLFIVFGAFLEATGISDFFISLANSLCGRFAGGPAKVAVVSSALCGMVSGSSVGNTVTTGSVTIPMMKKTGYKPEFAGAVEAAASTGGQIMPPIMGAAAFLMAEYMGVTYGKVTLYAILPAVLYFSGIFIAVHLEAKKLGLKGIPRAELTPFRKLARDLYLLLPLIILVWMVTANVRSLQFSAAIAILVAIAVSLIGTVRDSVAAHKGAPGAAAGDAAKRTGSMILSALEAGGKGSITVAVACSMAGIIAGCITVTGLASKLISGVVAISRAIPNPTLSMLIALFLTMLCCIVLGMGVPTTANYCIMASTCAPILITLGVPKVAAHFFVFYFGIVADITPPVALAAYAGSAIAKSNPMKTGVNATKLAIAAFIVPYMFAMNPSMLLMDQGVLAAIQVIITSFLGIFGVSSALEGYIVARAPWWQRILLAAGGLSLIDPTWQTDLIGLAVIAVVVVIQIATRKNGRNTPAVA